MIAHLDADSFFASVLVRKDPRLQGKPLLALGMGGSCVIAATYEAKAFGVKTGMRLMEARKLVPGAIELPCDFAETAVASRQIESIVEASCPIFEQMSVDEWYMDLRSCIGGDPSHPQDWATALRDRVKRETALSVSVGVGPTKLLAKMAGEYRKPAGVTVIDAQVDLALEPFLRDRPAAAIPGIGRKRVQETDSRGWKTAWDFSQADPLLVQQLFGRGGLDLRAELQGESVSAVTTESGPPKSIQRARSFRSTSDRDAIWASILDHLAYTVLKMRRQELACRGVTVWLRNSDYRGEGDAQSFPQALTNETQLLPAIRQGFDRLYRPGQRYTQTGLSLWRLGAIGGQQFSLFTPPETLMKNDDLQKAVDDLRERYGKDIVKRGSALTRSQH